MSDNILEFKPRRFDDVWECACGGQLFYILESMRIECRACGKLSESVFATDKPIAGDGLPV